jgi:hypothetical protein
MSPGLKLFSITKFYIKQISPTKMQITKKIVNNWATLKERGDVKKIAKILRVEKETASRILSGNQTTSTKNLLKINEFFNKRKVERAQLIDDNN